MDCDISRVDRRAGTPALDLTLGTILIAVFVFTIVRFGLLATTAALTAHFILLRAPITTHLSSWRGPLGLWFVGTVAGAGLVACYFARAGTAAAQPAPRPYEAQQV